MVRADGSLWTATCLDLGESVRWQRLQKALHGLPGHAWKQRLSLISTFWRQAAQERVLLQLDGVWHVVTGARILAVPGLPLRVMVQQSPTPAAALTSLGRNWLRGRRGLQALLPQDWRGRQVRLMALPGSNAARLWLDGQPAVSLPLTIEAHAEVS